MAMDGQRVENRVLVRRELCVLLSVYLESRPFSAIRQQLEHKASARSRCGKLRFMRLMRGKGDIAEDTSLRKSFDAK